MPQKPVSIEILDESGGRFLVTTFPDGKVVRVLIDQTPKPGARKFRRPYQVSRVKRLDYTKKKRF